MSDVASEGAAMAEQLGAQFVPGDLRQQADCEQLLTGHGIIK
jgi:hypothetical protein